MFSRLLSVCWAVLVGVSTLPASAAALATDTAEHRHPTPVWATQLRYEDKNGQPWSIGTFKSLKADGMNSVEINLAWDRIQPSRGQFDFSVLDTEMTNAAAARVKVIPIFWQAVWGGNPARWITSREVTDTGAEGRSPAWWDEQDQHDYFRYVIETVKHLEASHAFGGAILNYGSLDAQWHGGPGVSGFGGYALADIGEFHRWLPDQYDTIEEFNQRYSTDYTSWDQVPPARPSDPLFPVYQAFRLWSVEETYGQLTAAVRDIWTGPLYYYYGGHLANARDYGNLPDIFFRLASRYRVTVIEDAAGSTGLTLLFGSLARSYRVPLMQEWTVGSGAIAPQAAQWLVHYGLGMPEGSGEDFFLYEGGDKYTIGFPIYTKVLPQLKALAGSYPQQPVALYVSFAQAYGDRSAGTLSSAEKTIAGIWSHTQMGFAVVTDLEVQARVVDLSRFSAVLPVNGIDLALRRYAMDGGHVLTSPEQLTRYAESYAGLSAPHLVEAVPTVGPGRNRASIMLAEVSQYYNYDGSIMFSTAGLNLKPGEYHLEDALTGTAIPQLPVPEGVCAPLSMASADIREWNLVPGPAPQGTPTPNQCPRSGSGATVVSSTAGQAPDGLTLLLVGNTSAGSDGNLRTLTLGGQQAVATWTSAQSRAACACSNVYMQIDPNSQVKSASDVAVTVSYWATPGQGFTVQYNGQQGAYENGPTVQSPGTGQWVTATVELTDARFDELQNVSADLRLQATDPTQPLTIHSVTIAKK